jgi:hypothetical protein
MAETKKINEKVLKSKLRDTISEIRALKSSIYEMSISLRYISLTYYGN